MKYSINEGKWLGHGHTTREPGTGKMPVDSCGLSPNEEQQLPAQPMCRAWDPAVGP